MPRFSRTSWRASPASARSAGRGGVLVTWTPHAGQHGQGMVEMAIALPILLMVALGLLQFALFYHAQNVVTAAVQDGARVAASEDRTLAEGVAVAEGLLRAGLGQGASALVVRGVDGGYAVAIEAQGELRAIIPWVAEARLPLWARSVVDKERFRAGSGG